MEFKTKSLIILPVIVIIFSVFILVFTYWKTGDVFMKDVDLGGGGFYIVDFTKKIDDRKIENEIETKIGTPFISKFKSKTGYGFDIVVSNDVKKDDIEHIAKSFDENASINYLGNIGPLYKLSMLNVFYVIVSTVVISFLFVFMFIKKLVFSFGMIFAIILNLIFTISVISLLGLKVNFVGLVGLSFLIPYTINSNLILMKIFSSVDMESFNSNYKSFLKKNFYMAIAVVSVLLSLFFFYSKLLNLILEILIIGIFSDFLFTSIFNVCLYRILAEGRIR